MGDDSNDVNPGGMYRESNRMMLPTHAVVGLALAAPVLYLAPDHAPVVLPAAIAGSVFPDLDLYTAHRRALHFPSLYPILTAPVAVAAILAPNPVVVAAAAFLVGATVHCRMDRYGGGLELRPWEGRSERAVYDHLRGRWRRPKRWIRYDGSPRDLGLLIVVSIPLLVVLDGPYRIFVITSLVIGIVYVWLRRRLASLVARLLARLPERIAKYAPERYRG